MFFFSYLEIFRLIMEFKERSIDANLKLIEKNVFRKKNCSSLNELSSTLRMSTESFVLYFLQVFLEHVAVNLVKRFNFGLTFHCRLVL